MTTGLFASRSSTAQGIAARSHQRKLRACDDTLDRFAEALSNHGDPERAAVEIGRARSYGRVLLGKL